MTIPPFQATYLLGLIVPHIFLDFGKFYVLFFIHAKRPGHALKTFVRGKSSMPSAIWWLPNRHEWLSKESWSPGGLFGLWPNMSPASTYAKSFIKLPLDEADAGSLKLTNYPFLFSFNFSDFELFWISWEVDVENVRDRDAET